MSTPRVALVNLGCRVNRVETDLIAQDLLAAGCELVPQEDASAVVVNTCAVTGEAEAKARKAVRHAAALPQRPDVVATGCVACLAASELEALGPNVRVVSAKARVAAEVLSSLGLAPVSDGGHGDYATPTPTGRMRPGIKVQDGCDNRCTYCIVWKARGAGVSTSPEEVVRRVRESVSQGAHEVVLTGINLGRYSCEGEDGKSVDLAGLLQSILAKTDVERIRLSSIEPPDVTPRLVSAMRAGGVRVAPFLHVCLQSGCDRTLSRMGRVYGTAAYARAIEVAREGIPDLALGTDLIVGFPGETDADFEESLAFCRRMAFAKMHVFRYSRRPGTPAATYPDQVPPQVMAERGRRMRDAAREMRLDAARSLVGTVQSAIVQYPGRAVTGGLFEALVDRSLPLDSMVRVRVESVDAQGRLVGSPA
ncbi:MAG: MiaB/RimO family radical SAM methylthiotransferase [Olsenella sp.]|nr:MiaB/RimO family radical SAM methylthiotransferase [Olsenella sp.]